MNASPLSCTKPSIEFPSCLIRLSLSLSVWIVLRLTTTRTVVFATRSWLCTHYPLRAQEPIRSQQSVCRRESTFDPPLNYDENLQEPEKGSRASREHIFVLFTTICQDEDRRVLDASCFTDSQSCKFRPIAFSDDDWLSLFVTTII